jgi:hypothetical protein
VIDTVTRRQFLKIAAAGTAGVAALGTSAVLGSRYEEYLPKGGSKVNVVVVIVDSLRRDHVGAYGNGWIKTPNLDALAKESLLFTRPYPESIPTIPARRAIHTGVRTWPFRDWHPVSDDGFKPYGGPRSPRVRPSLQRSYRPRASTPTSSPTHCTCTEPRMTSSGASTPSTTSAARSATSTAR